MSLSLRIDETRCTGCGLCVEACPTGAIRVMDGVAHIDPALCRGCEVCRTACPTGAIVTVPASLEEAASSAPDAATRPRPQDVTPRRGVHRGLRRGGGRRARRRGR